MFFAETLHHSGCALSPPDFVRLTLRFVDTAPALLLGQLAGQASGIDGAPHRATWLGVMRTIAEPAVCRYLRDVVEYRADAHFRRPELDFAESGCIDQRAVDR